MSRGRWFGFIIAILLGLTAGLLYGWIIQPAPVANTTLASMRADYKADYVLMVAETYHTSGDISQAKVDLEYILPGEPLIAVQSATLTAQQLGYAANDLQMLNQLEMALTQHSPSTEATP